VNLLTSECLANFLAGEAIADHNPCVTIRFKLDKTAIRTRLPNSVNNGRNNATLDDFAIRLRVLRQHAFYKGPKATIAFMFRRDLAAATQYVKASKLVVGRHQQFLSLSIVVIYAHGQVMTGGDAVGETTGN
jgi:hypothetical protein